MSNVVDPVAIFAPRQRLAWPGYRLLVAALALLLVLGVAAVVKLVPEAVRSGSRASPGTARSIGPATPLPPPPPEQRVLDLPPETARVVNAERPFLNEAVPPPLPYRFVGSSEDRLRAVDCLAAASWYEAGDDAVGQRAVMQVVLNRVRHPAFARGVCGVVFQGSERSTGCQFTFACDGSIVRRRPSLPAWARAQALAAAALNGAVDRDVGFATHYHADYVVPYWAAEGDKLAQIGLHIFYRWHGFWGTRPAFTREPVREEPKIAALAALSPVHAGGDAQSPAMLAAEIRPDAATSAPVRATLPPPVQVEGVREKSMRGALVRSERGNQYFVQLDPQTFPGNYATAAVALCKGKQGCTVLGWRDDAGMGLAMPLTTAQREALTFYFHQSGDGNDQAKWNCGQIPRANKAQCLDSSALVALAER